MMTSNCYSEYFMSFLLPSRVHAPHTQITQTG